MGDTVQKKVEFVFAGNDEALKKAAEGADGVLKGLDAKLRESVKGFKQSFSLEALAKSGLLVSAAVNAIDVATRALSGDIRDAAEAVKALPLGVGQMATALENVLGKVTGIGAELKYLNELQVANTAAVEAGTAAWQARIRILRESREREQTTRGATRMIGLEGNALQSEQENQRWNAAVKRIDELQRTAVQEMTRASNERAAKFLAQPISHDEAERYYARMGRPSRYQVYSQSMGEMGGSPVPKLDWEQLKADATAERNQRIRESQEQIRQRDERTIRQQFAKEIEAENERHSKQLFQNEKDWFWKRVDALKKWGQESVKTTKDVFAEMWKNLKDPPTPWWKQALGIKEKAAGGRDASGEGIDARERRLAGRDWAAEVRPPEDPWVAWRRRVAAERADPVAALAARPPQGWDSGRPPAPTAEQLARQAEKTDQLIGQMIGQTNALLERIAEYMRGEGDPSPAMGDF